MRRYLSIAITVLAAHASATSVAQTVPAPEALDVTMQVIKDPAAQIPDEVVHRIPLPVPRGPARPADPPGRDGAGRRHGEDTSAQARELGAEIAEQARQQARDIAEQQAEAGRAIAEEARRNAPPLDPPPAPPVPPPRGP